MIVFQSEDSFNLVKQTEHARMSRVLSERSTMDPSSPVTSAIEHHDDGWREFDETPKLENDTVIDYRSVPLENHLEILDRSVRRCARIDPYCGYLVSRHGCSFHASKNDERVESFLNDQEDYRQKHLEKIDPDERTQIEIDFDWLQFTDALSLYLLDPWADTWSWRRSEPGEVTINAEGKHDFTYEGAGFESGSYTIEFDYRIVPFVECSSPEPLKKVYTETDNQSGSVTFEVP